MPHAPRKLLLLSLAACALVTCARGPHEEPPGGVESQAQALGVPQGGFPNWAERSLLVLSNRARADPQAALGTCTTQCADRPCYAPVKPLVWTYDLNRSARFHVANLLAASSGLQHESPCTLVSSIGAAYPATCDGSPACACTGGAASCSAKCSCGAGTGPFARIGLFFSGAACAENIAAGYGDPQATMDGWLLETCPTCVSDCSKLGTPDTHRLNILNGNNTELGAGAVRAPSSACYGGYWTSQDFGCDAVTIPKLVAGTQFPETGTTFSFYANWYDAAAPGSAQLNIDGVCRAMAVDRGSGGNSTYAWAGTVASGCHRYRFEFTDSHGAAVQLPSSGAYLAGSSCTADYDASPPAACTGSSSTSTSSTGGTGTTASATTTGTSSASTTASPSTSTASSTATGTTSSTGGATSNSGTTGSGGGSATSGSPTTGGVASAASGAAGGNATGSSGSSAGAQRPGTAPQVRGGCSSGAETVSFPALLLALALRRRPRTLPAVVVR